MNSSFVKLSPFQAYGLTHNRQLVSDKFDLAHAKSAPEENGNESLMKLVSFW